MKKEKNVVIPIWKYVRRGGVKVIINLATELMKQYPYCELVIVGKVPEGKYKTSVPYTELSVPRIVYWIVSRNPRLSIVWDIYAFWALLVYFSHSNATHVICNFHLQVFPASLAKIIFNKKYELFYYIQAYEPDFYPKKTLYQAIRRFLALTSYKIDTRQLVNSTLYSERNGNITSDPARVIVPGIDIDIFSPSIRNNNPLKVGTLFSPVRWKGSYDVIKAFEMLEDINIPAHFVIGTSYASEFDGNFYVHKINNEEDLVGFYQSVDLLVAVPTEQFRTPHYPILEGFACGCTVICTEFFLAEHLSTTWTVQPNDPYSIKEAVVELIDNHELREKLAFNGKESVKSISWENIGRKFFQILFQAER